MPNLLFELGSEELPARFIEPALADIERSFSEGCAALSIKHGAIQCFGTPRRLALHVHDLAEMTESVTKQIQGPSLKSAFGPNGKTPTLAAINFAASVKHSVDQLIQVTTPRGDYLAVKIHEQGRHAYDLLPEVLNGCIRKINFAKSMRWGNVEQTYGRSLLWIVALLGEKVVPVTYADVNSGRVTYGHRFMAPMPITLNDASDYEPALENAYVIPSIEKRRQAMMDKIELLARSMTASVIQDEALIEQVVNLVELPNPVMGSFERTHLELPPEVLIQEMKGHQRYFTLVDAHGKLLPNFIAVSNTPVKDKQLAVKGYERVLRARLTDGRFFFDEDRRSPFVELSPKLHRRSWVDKLGSLAEKTERIQALAAWITASIGKNELLIQIDRAAMLCKVDLNTGMVGEFPELQGVMGREYALHSNESNEVAFAIYEHYLPRSAGDSLPTHDIGSIVGLADRLDSLCGLFGIGKKPTGAKDDFSLRRAAISFIRIVMARGYRFSLSAAIDKSVSLLSKKFDNLAKRPAADLLKEHVLEFFRGRLESAWRENHRADLVEAVLAVGFDDLVLAEKRLEAISIYVKRADFSALAATFKRVANIVDKQAKDVPPGSVDVAKLLQEPEQRLNEEVNRAKDAVLAAIKCDDFAGAMASVVPLKPFTDSFFDTVKVMADDQAIRENRVRLLREIRALLTTIADFSKIQTEL